jgi:hypothetical protein
MSAWGTVADWFVAGGTVVLAAVAVFQDTIRGWFYRPDFRVSIKTEPPDCVAVPFHRTDGTFVAHSIYLRARIENIGNVTAKNVEVYAKALQRQRLDKTWEPVAAFPPMNLKWADIGLMYFPSIAPEMSKHCDIAHISDPARRQLLNEEVPRLGLTAQQASLAFDVVAVPNHRGHIVGPGDYRLEIIVAAENARPTRKLVAISLKGLWDPDETKMLRDGVGITVQAV